MSDDANLPDGNDSTRPESLLTGRSNPRTSLDYIVALTGKLESAHQSIRLRYVPDKLLIDSASFAEYLAFLDGDGPAAPEHVALTLLDEMNNEIVPRWVQIAVTGGKDDSEIGNETPSETIFVEDRQPNWENSDILDRLPPL